MLRRALALTLAVPAVAMTAASPASAADAPTCHGRVATVVGTSGDDRLAGTDGPDVIVGLGGNDQIWAARGTDLVCGGPGADELSGGRGDDALHGGLDEHVVRNGRKAWVRGDVLDGGAGDDLLDAHVDYGRRDMVRRPDTVTYRHSDGPVHVDLAAGTASGEGNDTVVKGDDLEVLGSAFDDELVGSSARDFLDGRGGDDRLAGRDSDDVLLDGAGDDALDGGPGGDLLLSSRGQDGVAGQDGGDFIIAVSQRSATVDGGQGSDYVMRQFVPGTSDVLDGGAGRNQLDLLPLFDDDNPVISVDRAAGTAVAQDGSTSTTAAFSNFGAFTLDGRARWDYVGTDERDFLQVMSGKLVATTLGGDDFMLGDRRDDTLDGGDGTDEAWGGKGSNTCLNDERGKCDGYPWTGTAAARVLPTGRPVARLDGFSSLRPALGEYAAYLR